MKKQITVSDFIINRIAKEKVKNIFLLPGGGNMYLIDAIAKCKKVKAVPMHHEHAASIAAESYSRISENLGVAVVTSGPGATNAITGILGAWIESVPLIIISGQVKTTDIKKHLKLRQQGVQGANILKMVDHITKFSISLTRKSNVNVILNKCISIAKSGRAGPVWLEVPLDVQAKLINNKVKKENIIKKNNKIARGQIKKIKKLISESERPLFLIGHGVRLSKAEIIFKKVIKKLNIPCVFTWNAMDLLSHDHNLNYGKPGIVAQRYPNFVLQNSDLLISIGCRIDNVITAFNEKNFAPNAKKIIIDIDPEEIKKFKFKNSLKLKLDAKIFLECINKEKIVVNKNIKTWLEICSRWKKNFNYKNEKNIIKTKNKFSHYNAVEILSKNLPDNKLICTGSSGLAVEVFYSIFRNKQKQRIFLTSGLGSMGYGIPASIGATFASKKPAFLIEGDGSFQQNIQELAVISQFKLPITIFLFNNNGYCSIKNTQKNYFNKRFVGTGSYSNLMFPDTKKICEAYRIRYIKVKDQKELMSKMKNIVKNIIKPQIIEIMLDENEILAPKVSAMPQKNGNIISMPLEDMSPLLPLKQLEKEMLFSLSKASYLVKRK